MGTDKLAKHLLVEMELAKKAMEDLFPEGDKRRGDAMIIAGMYEIVGRLEGEIIMKTKVDKIFNKTKDNNSD